MGEEADGDGDSIPRAYCGQPIESALCHQWFPMRLKLYRSYDMYSYSFGNIVLNNVANAVHDIVGELGL